MGEKLSITISYDLMVEPLGRNRRRLLTLAHRGRTKTSFTRLPITLQWHSVFKTLKLSILDAYRVMYLIISNLSLFFR